MTEQPESAVEVIQTDRVAAASAYNSKGMISQILAGKLDHYPFVQACAQYRHRLATQPAEAQGVGEVERLREALGRIAALDPRKLTWFGGFNRAQEIAMDAIAAAPQAPAGGEESKSTVAFVQEWMMSGDHEPDQWHRDFAAAIDARCTPQRADAEDVERVDPELVERVRHAVEHPDAKGFQLAKAGMTRHDFRRILAALAAMPRASDDGLAAMERLKRDQFCSGPDCTEYDHGRDEGISLAISAYTAAMPRASQQEEADALKLSDEYAAKRDWHGAYCAMKIAYHHASRKSSKND